MTHKRLARPLPSALEKASQGLSRSASSGSPNRNAAHPLKTQGGGAESSKASDSKAQARAGEHSAGEEGKEEGEKQMSVIEAALMNAGGGGILTQLERNAGHSGGASPAADRTSSPTSPASPAGGRSSPAGGASSRPSSPPAGASSPHAGPLHRQPPAKPSMKRQPTLATLMATPDPGVQWEQEEEDE